MIEEEIESGEYSSRNENDEEIRVMHFSDGLSGEKPERNAALDNDKPGRNAALDNELDKHDGRQRERRNLIPDI